MFSLGDFELASGARSAWKINCDDLTPVDWQALAWMLVERMYLTTGDSYFGDVIGVPTGGLALAAALRPHVTADHPTLLVVDDVWTTGGSMGKFIATLPRLAHRAAVVFARGPLPDDVTALFRMQP